MDIAIQSQIQSPLVRTLQSIPTNSANFVHGIPDNTPPFSKSTVRVDPYDGDPNKLKERFRFKIPQGGHLNRVVLNYRMIGHKSVGSTVLEHEVDTPFNFGNGIEKIELRARTDVIETIYPASLPFEALSTSSGEQMGKNLLQGLAGYSGSSSNGSIIHVPPRYTTPTLGNRVVPYSSVGDLVVQDFIVPVPLSSTFYLKDNFQTRLLEDLELVVYTRVSPTQATADYTLHPTQLPLIDRQELSLTLDFINFHENVEEVIRNENFKPNVPAALLQSDREHFKAKWESSSISGNVESVKYSVDLNTDALVTDIFVAPRAHPSDQRYDAYTSLVAGSLHFELVSGGNTILSGFKQEFDGVLGMNYSTVTRQYQNEGVFPLRWSRCGTHIRLGLNHTDEFFDGGISFQSLQNPKLIITMGQVVGSEASVRTDVGVGSKFTRLDTEANQKLVEFDVVLKRKVMLRIDGNTGKISKSLES